MYEKRAESLNSGLPYHFTYMLHYIKLIILQRIRQKRRSFICSYYLLVFQSYWIMTQDKRYDTRVSKRIIFENALNMYYLMCYNIEANDIWRPFFIDNRTFMSQSRSITQRFTFFYNVLYELGAELNIHYLFKLTYYSIFFTKTFTYFVGTLFVFSFPFLFLAIYFNIILDVTVEYFCLNFIQSNVYWTEVEVDER